MELQPAPLPGDGEDEGEYITLKTSLASLLRSPGRFVGGRRRWRGRRHGKKRGKRRKKKGHRRKHVPGRYVPSAIEVQVTEAARAVSERATRALLLLKQYILRCDENRLPVLDHSFMRDLLGVVGVQPTRGRRPTRGERINLDAFYRTHFAPLLPNGDVLPSSENLGGVIGYTARELLTNVENNIKQHLVKYVRSYVDAKM
jgi:hypothetical protein